MVIVLLTWATEAILSAAGLSLATYKGYDFAGILFGGMLYFYCYSGWPFRRVRQPMRGVFIAALILVIGGVALPAVLWNGFNIPYGMASVWVFCAWYVSVFTQWLTAPWPSLDTESTFSAETRPR